MKFILSFLFAFVFISPVMAEIATSCPGVDASGDTSQEQCQNTPGCLWTTGMSGGCSKCSAGNACQNGQVVATCSNNLGDGKQHPDGASSCDDWVCATGYTQSGDSCYPFDCNFPVGQILRPGATSCDDWFCDINYYAYGSSCFHCPGNGTTDSGGNTIAAGVGVCSQCSNNQNIIANIQDSTYYDGTKESPYFCGVCDANTTYDEDTFSCVCNVTYSHQDSLLSCACPTHSTPNGGTCVCNSGWYMPVPSNEQNPRPTTCLSCPEHATCSNNEVTCGQNTIKTVNTTDGTVTCATCGANASVVSNVCTCDVNAYGNGTNCTRCPAGTFLNRQGTSGTGNATEITDCQMNHNTQFCDANGANCMQLIPES